MSYTLQFFSRPSDEGESPDTAAFGYDGSMTVEAFSEDDIQGHLAAMDCIYGECLVIVSWPGRDAPTTLRKAFRTTRRDV